MNRLRVVQVISDTNIGGAGKCVLTYLRYYDIKKYKMYVVVPKGSLILGELKGTSATVIEVEGIADKSLDFGAVKSLKAVFKSIKPDIVHTHANMSARIAAKRIKIEGKRIKVVYTRHSVFEPSMLVSRGIGKKINGFINNHYSTAIIAVAEAARDNLTRTGIREDKIHVILNGVEPVSPMKETDIKWVRKKFNVEKDDFVCAIIARVTAVKGHSELIDGFKILKDKGYSNIKLIIAGTGDELENIKQKVKSYKMEDTIIFAGFLNDVKPLMNLMDLQINTSYGTEATSLSLLEGMSLGKPAVVSDFGGNPGVIENGVNGFLFPTHNIEKMAELVEKVYLDKEMYGILSAGSHKTFEAKFYARLMAENIETLYSSI